ncbi:MAG: hypothetical protein QM779_08675 [Propionicimonas sp.]|uniref:hypothetical protein n=1 Tax=Propionicimonas sp. TaxID=1955623 RepID=UPI003D0F0C07
MTSPDLPPATDATRIAHHPRATAPAGPDATVPAGRATPAAPARPPAGVDREPPAELPLPTAAEARAPALDRERYATRLPPPPAGRPGTVAIDSGGTLVGASRPHEDGTLHARRIAASRRRQAAGLVVAVVAVVAVAATLLVLLVLGP